MAKSKVSLAIIVILLCSYLLANRLLKVNYNQTDVVNISGLVLNDSIVIGDSYVILGKNHKGFIEATIIPTRERKYKNYGIVEYYYLRFAPKWYENNISPRVISRLRDGDHLSADLIKKAEIAHNDNFKYCCHTGNYPLINEDLVFARISLVGVADKISSLMLTNK